VNNKDEEPTASQGLQEEEQLDLDPNTLGHGSPVSGTGKDQDSYQDEDDYMDWDEPDLDTDTPGHGSPVWGTEKDQDFYLNEDEYVDWDEPDRDTAAGGAYALDKSLEYFDDEAPETEDYPATGNYIVEEEVSEITDDQNQAPSDENFDATALENQQETEDIDWQEEEDSSVDEQEEGTKNLPLGLIAVAVVAVILLGIGGYGVVQERTELEEEIRQLQAGLATRADPEQLLAADNRVEELERQNRELRAEVEELSEEYRMLSGTIASLQVKLKTQREQAAAPAPKSSPDPAPATRPAIVTAQPAGTGNWWVNFGAYSLREAALSWSKRLTPGAGEVIVAPATSGGKTVYRVRVIGLANKEEADRVAGRLKQEYKLDKLWVGRTP